MSAIPRNDLCSTYAIYNTDTNRISLRRLPFDFGRYTDEMVAHGVRLPRWLIDYSGHLADCGKVE